MDKNKKRGILKRFFALGAFGRNCNGMKPESKVLYYMYNVLLLTGACIAMGLASLLIAYGPGYSNRIFIDYLCHPYLLFLNILPCVLLTFLLYALIGRSWIAYSLSSLVIIGFSIANYFLLKFRDDPLMFSDILYIKEAANISNEGYDYSLGIKLIFAIATCVGFAVVLALFQRWKPKGGARVYLVCLVCLAGIMTAPLYSDSDVYNNKTQNFDHANRWSSTQLYISKGFVYPFIHSIEQAGTSAPDGYDEEKTRQILAAFEDADIPEDKKINVMGIMLEAFCDLEKIGITGISQDVYSCYRRLREENLSGELVTNIFGGNTIQSERAFLTGCIRVDNYRRNVNSYVRYFNSQGYYTDGAHPSEDWFYNRKNINKYLGFEDYRFKENYFEEKYGNGMRLDSNVLPDIFDHAKQAIEEGDKPYFGFSVTYQGHGPYATNYREWGNGTYYNNPNVSEQSNFILDNYLGSVKDTGWRLLQLVEKIQAEQEPIVLVVFGDHKPWLGDGNSVYNELGINIDVSTHEGFMNYYGTEYVIIANDAAKKVTGNDFTGKGPTTSPCFLMNVLFDNLGWQGPAFMQYTDTVMAQLPALNDTATIDSAGHFSPYYSLAGYLIDVKDEYKYAQYYENNNFRESYAE